MPGGVGEGTGIVCVTTITRVEVASCGRGVRDKDGVEGGVGTSSVTCWGRHPAANPIRVSMVNKIIFPATKPFSLAILALFYSQEGNADKMKEMKAAYENKMIGLVGERGIGKTSLLLALIAAFQNRNLQIAGVISPGIFEGSRKVAIELIDLTSRESRLLARLTEEEETGLRFGDWSFFEETLAWGNQRLSHHVPADVLILDEIGPLELDLNQGLQAGLDWMAEGGFQLCLTSLRSRCAESIQRKFPEITLFYLDSLDSQVIKETILRIVN